MNAVAQIDSFLMEVRVVCHAWIWFLGDDMGTMDWRESYGERST